ncbi:hypothetical protein AVL62_03895 [Serinicoccus chungangensis]|uniref:DUF3866 domain-containing protein n=1 Tax=Serinicoccus chungangensis TaxID=767452 RepID=A0A0W8I7B7_9MICO|nr:DUF3866 family protein [Serinicoccus chungangensis]KUG54507.1 hypothetical protein AVL62_03895 [Serinicoccus chungangensis]
MLPGWAGVQVLGVEVQGERVRALGYPDLVGSAVVGDRVLLNVTALERGLGTGGYALVVALPDRPDAWPRRAEGEPGHLVKGRYAPLQPMVLGVDDPEGEHHATLAQADDLGGMPVLATDLHSALPAVLAGVRAERPRARVAYVMTDGAALPLAWSRTVAGLREAGWLASTVTAGQAFGGDLEAVTVHTALLAARHVVGADLAVVIQGPGNLGTETRWGFSGVAAGEALNAAAVLGGRPVAGLRVSQADARERHRGLSHHSTTAFGRVLAHPADLPVPVLPPAQRTASAADAPSGHTGRAPDARSGHTEPAPDAPSGHTGRAPDARSGHTEPAPDAPSGQTGHAPDAPSGHTGRVGDSVALRECLALVHRQARDLVRAAPHLELVEVATEDLPEALAQVPVPLSTMGRGLGDDPAAFLTAAAAGRYAARLVVDPS